MENTQTQRPPSLHWFSLFQFGLSGVVILLLWGMAFYMLAGGMFQFSEGISFRQVDPSGFLMAAGFAWIGALILPSAWFALMRLMNRPVHFPRWATRWVTRKNAGGVIWWMVPVVLAGYGAAVTPAIAWLVLPPLNVLALSIPVVWYLSLGGRGLQGSSPQSTWGVLGIGLTLGPGLILLLELLGGALGAIVLVVWLSPLPGFTDELQRLLNILQTSSNIDPTLLLPFAEKYFMRRSVLVGGLLYLAGFAPLLEEFFKPVGLWLMNKQTLTPARGFLAGMLSGAAFGLFESLLQAVPGEEWVQLAVARTGTSLIHIFNSGLVGWGIALACTRGPMPWIKRYLIAVAIHGLWNGMTVMTAVASLPDQDLVAEIWGLVGTGVLLVLAVGCFLSLIAINRRLQREELHERLDTENSLAQDSAPALGSVPYLGSTPLPEPDGIPLVEENPPERVIP